MLVWFVKIGKLLLEEGEGIGLSRFLHRNYSTTQNDAHCIKGYVATWRRI